jgi:uncharacterized protein (DUF3084 family)
MADVTSLAIGATTVGANYRKNTIHNGDVGREFILSITAGSGQLTQAKLNAAIDYLTVNHGAEATNAGTIGGIATSDGTAYNPAADTVVFVKLQTTATFTVTGVNAAATDTTVAIVCEFKPAK